MTRKEAISKWIYPAIATMWNEKNVKKILEALEQEPCEDCISREAVFDLIATWLSDYLTVETREALETIVDKIEDIPSVTPQPKTGHWIHFASGDDCSECGWSTGKYISPSKYCPNCGIKMGSEV